MSNIKEKIYILTRNKNIRVVLLFLARFSNPLLSLIFSLIATRSLSVEGHGVYAKNFAWIIVLQALLEVGLTNSLVRFLAPALKSQDKNQVHSILRAAIQLKFYALVLIGGLILVYVILSFQAAWLVSIGIPDWLLPKEAPNTIYLYWLIFTGGFGLSLLTFMDSILVAHEDYLRIFLWIPTVGMIRLALLAIFLFSGPIEPEHVLYAFCIGPYLSLILFFMIFSGKFFAIKIDRASWKPWISTLFKFNTWIILAAFMAICSDWMEMLIISRPSDNGMYNAARLPMQAFMILLTTMSSILMPPFSHLKNKKEFEDFFVKIYRLILPGIVLFVPGFIIFPWFIVFWWGPEFYASLDVFYILYPGFILRIYFAPLGIALFALDQPRIIAIEAGLRVFSGLILVQLFYNEYGITGAAWASLISQFSGWIFLLYCYWKYFTTGAFPTYKKNKVAAA